MRKTFKVEGIDCPNCAAKLERNIQKIKGVEDAAVVYATGKLTVEASDDKFEAIMDEAVALAAKLEPDWHIIR
ncbi:MAG: cation transporter [Firmicutes bacterium]|nr:cation transporter [Bacillota bacterium]